MRAEGAVLCCSSALAPAARPCPRPRRCPAPARHVQLPHRPPRPPSRPRKAPSPRAARLAIRDGAHPCPLAAGRKVRRPPRPPPRPRPRARRRGRSCQGCARPADGLRDVPLLTPTHPQPRRLHTARGAPPRPAAPIHRCATRARARKPRLLYAWLCFRPPRTLGFPRAPMRQRRDSGAARRQRQRSQAPPAPNPLRLELQRTAGLGSGRRHEVARGTVASRGSGP